MKGSPATEKIGIFWLSTRQLNTSIIGTSVRIISEATMRRIGFTEGPPMSIRGSSSSAGPPSIGSPDPPKTRPMMLVEYTACIG